MPLITAGYPKFVRNDEILVILLENGFFYNKVHIKPIEILEGNHFNGFKTILVSYGAKKIVVVNPKAKVLMNLLSKTPFHNVIITKFVPLNPGGDPLEPLGGARLTFVQHLILYFRPFKGPLNYPKSKKNFDLDVHG